MPKYPRLDIFDGMPPPPPRPRTRLVPGKAVTHDGRRAVVVAAAKPGTGRKVIIRYPDGSTTAVGRGDLTW